MSQLIQLKQRIRSIKTTHKLTHAMRLISMSLYSKLDKQRLALEYYKKSLNNLFQEIAPIEKKWANQIFFPEDILNSTPIIIIISASKGFCGGLNANLFRYIEHSLFIEEHQTPLFLTIGQRATNFVQQKNLGTILASYHDLTSNNFPHIAHHVTKAILQQSPPFSSVTIYSTFLKNFFAQIPQKNRIIPLKKEESNLKTDKTIKHKPKEAFFVYAKENEKQLNSDIIWEQDCIKTIDFLAERYLDTAINNIIYQSLISEYASRFVAMDSATTNAVNYLESLTLQFNKLRQALITSEVSELSSSL